MIKSSNKKPKWTEGLIGLDFYHKDFKEPIEGYCINVKIVAVNQSTGINTTLLDYTDDYDIIPNCMLESSNSKVELIADFGFRITVRDFHSGSNIAPLYHKTQGGLTMIVDNQYKVTEVESGVSTGQGNFPHYGTTILRFVGHRISKNPKEETYLSLDMWDVYDL